MRAFFHPPKPLNPCSLLVLSGLSTLLTACQSLPSTAHLEKSLHITEQSRFVQQAFRQNNQPLANNSSDAQHGALSGYYPIATGADAFASRSALTSMATQTIDIQYYIWHDDEAGRIMIQDLWAAANRGVVVRLLLDDFNSSPKLDELLLAFSKHPNVAVRLANPFAYRKFRGVNFITEPARINRRMHNKSMTFDNHTSIIGGRNIGDEYLNNAKQNNFADMDVLLTGAVVDEIVDSFEEYWASASSYDIETVVKPSHKALPDIITAFTNDTKAAQARHAYQQAIKNSTLETALRNHSLDYRWAKIDFLADGVDKLTKHSDLDTHLIRLLQDKLGRPNQQFSIISSYFVPTKDGVRTLTRLAKSGVKINILTNSFDATDVGTVHAGYGHWRQELLSAGIGLYEVKANAINGKPNTTTSLHAKAFAVDNEQVFIGSYNIDPRSANINTELGVIIHDEQLANQLHQALQSDKLLNQAYKIILNKQHNLEWHTLEYGKYTIYQREPNMNLKERGSIALMSTMPIDWLL